jgi:hypothetical protein
MKNLIVCGDIHHREKEPFYSQIKDFFKWYINSKYNSEDNGLILLGDLIESVDSSYELLSEFIDLFLNYLKHKEIYILLGNHDTSIKTSSLSLFKPFSNIKIIDKIANINIEGMDCLFLPFYYVGKDENKLTKEEFYSNLPDQYYEKEYDYVFHHLETEEQHFPDHAFCDLSKLKRSKTLAGHIHVSNIDKSGSYLGSIGLNSKTESGKTPYIASIDVQTKKHELIEVPKTLEYYEVTYPDNLPEINTKYAVFTVKDSIDKVETVNYYKKQAEKKGYVFYSNKILSKKLKEQELYDNEDIAEEKNHLEWFALFKKQNKLNKDVANICEEIIKKKVS